MDKEYSIDELLAQGELYQYQDDYIQAMDWYLKAVAKGSTEAMIKISFLYDYGDDEKEEVRYRNFWLYICNGVTELADQAVSRRKKKGLIKDTDESLKWLIKAANAGDAGAMGMIGHKFWIGHGVKKNYRRAKEWLLKAADNDDGYGNHAIGLMYYQGSGARKNYKKAMEWFLKNTEQNTPYFQTALVLIGDMFYNGGTGIKQDYQEAIQWYLKAAKSENPYGIYSIGKMYYEGVGVEQSYQKALEYFIEAANEGHTRSMYTIGRMYYEGVGVEKSFIKAKEWLEQSLADEDRPVDAEEILEEINKILKLNDHHNREFD